MDMITKQVESEIVDVLPGSREVVACISAATLDRENEVVLPGGLRKKNYAGMTIFYDHDTALPVAVSQWVKQSGGKLLAKHRFSDKTQFSRDCFALCQDGVLRSYSIGFLPHASSAPTQAEIKSNPDWQNARRVYRDWELLEYSLVGVPANPDAVAIAVAKGVCQGTIDRLRLAKVEGATVEKSSGVMLHHAAEEHARALIAAGRIDRDGDWSWDAADADARLSAVAGDWTAYSLGFLGTRPMAPPKTKEAWEFPVLHGNKVSVAGLRAAISRAAETGDTEIEHGAQALLAAAKARKSAQEYIRLIGARLSRDW